MASKPLDILKKGLAKLKISFKAKKEHLKAKLSRQESISSLEISTVKARENIEINGGDDVDEGVDTEPLPTSSRLC